MAAMSYLPLPLPHPSHRGIAFPKASPPDYDETLPDPLQPMEHGHLLHDDEHGDGENPEEKLNDLIESIEGVLKGFAGYGPSRSPTFFASLQSFHRRALTLQPEVAKYRSHSRSHKYDYKARSQGATLSRSPSRSRLGLRSHPLASSPGSSTAPRTPCSQPLTTHPSLVAGSSARGGDPGNEACCGSADCIGDGCPQCLLLDQTSKLTLSFEQNPEAPTLDQIVDSPMPSPTGATVGDTLPLSQVKGIAQTSAPPRSGSEITTDAIAQLSDDWWGSDVAAAWYGPRPKPKPKPGLGLNARQIPKPRGRPRLPATQGNALGYSGTRSRPFPSRNLISSKLTFAEQCLKLDKDLRGADLQAQQDKEVTAREKTGGLTDKGDVRPQTRRERSNEKRQAERQLLIKRDSSFVGLYDE